MPLEEAEEASYRTEVLWGAKEVYKFGLSQFAEGNVSMRVKKADEMFITPSQNDYETMTEEDIVYMSFSGETIRKGPRRASSEFHLHKAIYEDRKKVNCVIHCHAPYASMLAVTHKKIPVILEEMLVYIGGEVNIAPFGESGSEGFGKAALEGLGTTNATILANHGILVCGKDMRLTVKAANLVEKVARIYWGALQIGDVHELEPEKQAKFIELFKGVASTANRPSKV